MESTAGSKQRVRPDLAKVTALAGEIYGFLGSCREFMSEVPTHSWGRLSSASSAILGASSLDDHFQAKAAFQPGGTPETMGVAARAIHERLQSLSQDIKALTAEKLRLEEHLNRVVKSRQEIVEGLGGASARVAGLRREHSVQAAEHGRLMEEKGPVWRDLRRQAREHADYLRRAGLVNRNFPSTSSGDQSLARRRELYRTVKKDLDVLKAELGISRAELAVKASQLARASAELERDKALAAARLRMEEKDRLDLEQRALRLAEVRQSVRGLKLQLKDLSRIRRVWSELQRALSSWPDHCRTVALLAEQSADPKGLPSLEGIARLDRQLLESVRGWRELAEQLEELHTEGQDLRGDYGKFESEILSFSRMIDGQTADYDCVAQSPIQDLKSLVDQARNFRQEYLALTERRDDLSARLAGVGESINAVNQAWLGQLAHRKSLVKDYVASIRGRAIRRGALAHQERLLHEQLAALHAGLPGLIGPSAFLEGCLISGVLALAGTHRTLEQWKSALAQAHDRLDLPPFPEEAGRPAEALALVRDNRSELERLDKVAEAMERLPRQLSAFRAALVRGRRLANLQEAYQRRGEKIVFLDRDRRRLVELVRKSRKQVTFMVQERERLASDLAGARRHSARVTAHVKDELYPLVRTLGLALYQGQVRTADLLKREEAKDAQLAALSALAAELELGKQKAEGGVVRLSGLLSVMGREQARREEAWQSRHLQLTAEARTSGETAEALSRRIKELEAAYLVRTAKHKKQFADLNLRLAELEAGKKNEQAVSRQLSLALVQLGEENQRREKVHELRRNRLYAAAKVWQGRARDLDRRAQEFEASYLDSLSLIRRQSLDLQGKADRLAELYPLLSFFMDRLELWAGPKTEAEKPVVELPQGSEYLVVFLHMLRQENEALRDAVTVLKQDRQSLALENEHLAQSHQAIKARLEELLPVFRYYWQSWLATTARLAESESGRLSLSGQLADLKSRHALQTHNLKKIAARLEHVSKDLAAHRGALIRTRAERDESLRLQSEFKALFEKTRSEAEALRQTRAEMAGIIAGQQSGLSSLRDEVGELDREKRRTAALNTMLHRQTEDLTADVEDLTYRLADQSGQVEAAWAGLAHLAESTRAAVAKLQNGLEAQSRTIRNLERTLDQRSAHVGELERQQDRLGLLFWVMARYGGQGEVLEALVRQSREPGFRDAADLAGARLQELALGVAAKVSSQRFRNLARSALRRGLYSLLLAGGIVMGLPQESSKATALPSELSRPGEMVKLMRQEPVIQAGVPVGPIYSKYLERPFDIGFLSPWDKAEGFEHIEEKIRGEIDAQARGVGLDPDAYLRLVRGVYKPNQTVSLTKLRNEKGTVAILTRYFPNISAEFKVEALDIQDLRTLYQLAGADNPAECLFWDRLYADFRNLDCGSAESLAMVMNNARWSMARQASGEKPEFAGTLAPIPELEQLRIDGFTRVITPYIRTNIKTFVSTPAFSYAHKPEEIAGYAESLAQDMYVAAQIFGVPRTLFISIAHQETYFANVLGDNSMSASPFQIYQPTKPIIIKSMIGQGLQVPAEPEKLQDHLTLATFMAAFYLSELMDRHTTPWRQDQAPLCDLDRVAWSYNGGEAYPKAVYGKKLRLVGYLDRVRQVAVQKKQRPRT
jgi:DNA repair exonuclease SbcCD ATPase subunit